MSENDELVRLRRKITRLEKALEAERNVRRSLENAIETLDDGFILYDKHDRLEYVNSKLKTMYPRTADHLVKGAKFEDLLRVGAQRGEYPEAEGKVEQWVAQRLASRKSGKRDFEQELGDGRWIKNSDRHIPGGGTVCLRVDITKLKKAELTLRSQSDFLEALHQVSLGLFARTDLDTLLKMIITRAASLAGTEHGFINLFDKETQILECKYATGRAVETVGVKLAPGEGLAGRAFVENRPLLITDYKAWEGKLKGKIFEDMATGVVIPLKDQIGVFGLVCYKNEECNFSEFAVSTLSRFAELASLALHQANLNNKLDEELAQRRATEHALIASRERYRQLLQSVPNAVVVYDAKGKATFINDVFEKTYGWTLEEFSSGQVVFVPPEEKGRMHSSWRTQVDTGSVSFSTRRFNKKGNLLEVEIHGTSLHNSEGEYEGAVILHHNVTERNRAERAIKDKEKRLQAILEANPDPVVVYDEQGRVTYLNPAFVKTFGWDFEELNGKRVPFVPEKEKEITFNAIKRLYEDGLPSTFETKRFTKNGDTLDVLVSAARITDTEGNSTGMVVNLTDMTSFKQLESQLRQSQKMEAVGTLAGGIAHDFNNILHAISGYAQLLAPQAQEIPQGKQYHQEIIKAVGKASDLVRNLLTFSRKVESRLKPLAINREVRQSIRLLERTLPRMIEIETSLQDKVWPVNGDANQIEQTLLNLGLNAADAMPQGGKLIISTQNVVLNRASPDNDEKLRGEYIRLSVADNGTGVSPDHKKHIFDPFFTTKEVGKGTGLGLAMVYGVIKNHNGHISCRSTLGQGTEFIIHLPRLREPADRVRDDEPPVPKATVGNETILLVDDEPSILGLGQTVLEQTGYRILTAACGEEALKIYEERGPEIDLVLLDLNMPGMGGDKCLQHLLKIDPEAKVVVASGYSAQTTVAHITSRGAKGYLVKPFRLFELTQTVRQVIDQA